MLTKVAEQTYLEAIAQLTESRDDYVLSVCLLQTLKKWVPTATFTLYGLSNDNNEREFSDVNLNKLYLHDTLDRSYETERTVDDEPDIRKVIETQNSMLRDLVPGVSKRLILPIFGKQYVIAVLVVEDREFEAREIDMIAYLLRIYSSQIFLLFKGEFDALTGLLNRQAFDDHMRKLVADLSSLGRRIEDEAPPPMTFAIIDIDHFKQVNDKYGHVYGDEVLILFARLMTRTLRRRDQIFRYGGEEFAVLLSDPLDTAVIVFERFRKAIEAFDFPQIGCKTASVGVTAIKPGDSIGTIIDNADKALYYAKNHGRNRVCAYEKLVASGELVEQAVEGGDVELF